KPGSMGKPMPIYTVDLVDKDGNSVPPGVVGEIVIKGDYCDTPGLFRGYYRAKDKTDEVWHDGWYHTGDTATRDEDGYYWYVGRTDDVIKSSGYRIGPFEVESVVSAHPAVLECAVTGAPHPIRGEVVKASIILTDEYKDKAGEDLVKEIQDFVKHNTAPYKYPRIVEFVDELPKTTSGKVRRNEIRKHDFEKSSPDENS
ncbi:MAG: AMP-binding protein, partial [Oscillospiraceae bacterium]|nr:AMP-binding protein [Oscillospiraceae bacterium]